MKPGHLILCALALTLGQTDRLMASPTMIRLGYSDCATCHVSPQGGGLLTAYGKGIDAAQSLRVYEVPTTDVDRRRLLYDVRVVLGSQLLRAGDTAFVGSSTIRALTRSSVRLSDRSRFNYAFGVESPALTAATPIATLGNSLNLSITKALWDYRFNQSLQLSVGRDEMPSGIGLPDPQAFIRNASDAGNTAYPTQVKAFIATHRLQITPYLFGPGGDEPQALREHGAGVVAGVEAWQRHGILGMTLRTSNAAAFDRDSVGAFARLGFGRWGILAEHDLTSRSMIDTSLSQDASYLAGHTEVFVALKEWLVTTVALEDLVVPVRSAHTDRFTLGVQARISDRLTLIVNARDVVNGTTAGRQRLFSFQLAVKSLQ